MSAPQPFEGRAYHDGLEDVPPPAMSTQLIGHDRSAAEAVALVGAGRHAILFEGNEGIGKATTAFHLANALLEKRLPKTGAPPAPDPGSAVHRQIAQGGHPNLLHLTRPPNATGSGFRTVITVDEIRRLTHFLSLTPSVAAPRVVIIDPVGDMQRSAANALLKTLEEPPADTVFLLISHGGARLLPTIRSRCQRVRFDPLGDGDLRAVLDMVAPQINQMTDPDALVALAEGSVRHAITLALHGGIELRQTLDKLLSAPVYDTASAHKLAEIAGARGSDVHDALLRQMILTDVQRRARGAVAARATGLGGAARLAETAAELAQRQRVGAAFGLDRGQEMLVGLARLHALLHPRDRR